MQFATSCMELEGIVLNEFIQKEKDTESSLLYVGFKDTD